MFLLDTNVISELRRPGLPATVLWLQQPPKFNRESRFCLRQNGANVQFSPLSVKIAPWGTP
jgi:hypothetical protein